MRKYFKIKAEHPSGEWETIKLHRVFTIKNLADVFQYSEIWLNLPVGYTVYSSRLGKIDGHQNCWLRWDSNTNDYDLFYNTDPQKVQQAKLTGTYY